MTTEFPIESALPDVIQALAGSRSCVLAAPPGAGKTTRVPLALLAAEWMSGSRLMMLEPRRLAARRAAEFMASCLGEHVGETVGYRIRGETRVSSATRVEVVTEGVLTRLLQSDPSLPGVGLVAFDEFHERSIHADLGLAFMLDVQEHLRRDLRVLVMSATMRSDAVSRLLSGAPVIESAGSAHPVETRYLDAAPDGPVEKTAALAVRRALRESGGDILVFLPGQREIRRTLGFLGELDLPQSVTVHALFGEAARDQQDAALEPAEPGGRKVILSTNIAETSLTIDGVRIVVDAGLSRRSRFDPRRGMSGLVTEPVSKASADQRRGRAGRQAPGVCYRLWTERQHAELPEYALPEIASADLAQLALDLVLWGHPDGGGLRFLDPPPPAHLSHARALLTSLGAISPGGGLTPHGRAIAGIPVHPRLAHMLIRAREFGAGSLACDVAALLEERDILREKPHHDIDFGSRIDALRTGKGADQAVRSRAIAESQRLRQAIGAREDRQDHGKLGSLLALAYPERIAQRRSDGKGRFQMRSGTGALVPEGTLAREEFLAVADVDGTGTEVRVFLAAPLERAALLRQFADQIERREEVVWDDKKETVLALRTEALGALELSRHAFEPDDEKTLGVMIEGIRRMGLTCLPWSRESDSIRIRSEWLRLHGLVPEDWPNLEDQHLLDTLEAWLGPFLGGIRSRVHLARLNMPAVLKSRFSSQQLRQLDQFAPEALAVPTGSRVRLVYSTDLDPILPVRLQEMFGASLTPAVAGGKVPVQIHLLSPAGRPLAVTRDLPSFWKNAYPDVRKQMRGRYPKHHWPEDPLAAAPTRGTRTRGRRQA